MKTFSLRRIVLLGLMAALVCASSFFRVTIPLPVDKAAVHLGNVLCLLSGLLLGPAGGLSAGIGSFFFDLMDPRYAPEALITLCTKFFIGFFAGLISHAKGRDGLVPRWNVVGGVVGSLAYVVLYMGKSWIMGNYVFDLQAGSPMMLFLLPKLATSLCNGLIAVVCAAPLALAIRRALARSGLELN